MKQFIAYYRVSSRKQGESKLGLISQKKIVERYVEQNGGILVDEFVEVETGTSKKKRVEIQKAIESSKCNNAILLIAKIDRLARQTSFVTSLMDSGVKFVACDMPSANNFTITLMAALAQEEARLISNRTKKALEIKKLQGCTLGTPENLDEQARLKGLRIRQENARNNPRNKRATAFIMELRGKGLSYDNIADKLNEIGFKTSRNKKFTSTAVMRLYKRFIENSPALHAA